MATGVGVSTGTITGTLAGSVAGPGGSALGGLLGFTLGYMIASNDFNWTSTYLNEVYFFPSLGLTEEKQRK